MSNLENAALNSELSRQEDAEIIQSTQEVIQKLEDEDVKLQAELQATAQEITGKESKSIEPLYSFWRQTKKELLAITAALLTACGGTQVSVENPISPPREAQVNADGDDMDMEVIDDTEIYLTEDDIKALEECGLECGYSPRLTVIERNSARSFEDALRSD